jgi:hypothetical protein
LAWSWRIRILCRGARGGERHARQAHSGLSDRHAQLDDYLEEGLAQLGISLEDFERDRL